MLIFAATAVVLALAALSVTSPWHRGPSTLDRAAAAVAAPTSQQILEERISLQPEPPGAQGPLRARGDRGRGPTLHLWLEGGPPHRFRMTSTTCVRPYGCYRTELGGRIGSAARLYYEPLRPGVLDRAVFRRPISRSFFDPVVSIKTALTSGRAQLDGRATIRGHEVIRIRIAATRSGRGKAVALYFADAHTYRPVRIAYAAGPKPPGSLDSLPLVPPLGRGRDQYWPGLVVDFAEYRYLAPTADNRKLTNIRAQHPHAKIV